MVKIKQYRYQRPFSQLYISIDFILAHNMQYVLKMVPLIGSKLIQVLSKDVFCPPCTPFNIYINDPPVSLMQGSKCPN